MNKIEYVNFKKFEDEFGNLLNNFEVIQYQKNSDGKWIETERKESGKNTYIVDGQLYFRLNNSLIALNMDFDSKDCGACYQIGNTIDNQRSISNNEVLFTCKNTNGYFLSLNKQSYSDGTCFYTLKDEKGNWKVEYGSNDLQKLIKQIKHEIEVSNKRQNNFIDYPQEVKYIFNSLLELKNNVLNNLLALV